MLWMIPVLLLLCSGSVLAAAYGRRAEEAMPITAGTAVLLLYVFYAADRLPLGYYAVLAAGIACYALAAYRIIYNIRTEGGTTFLTNLATPGMAIFLVLCAAIWILVRKNTVNGWDELRLWAAYPKALYYSERLQLGAQAMLFPNMQSYLPGMALFCYLVEKLSGAFDTGRLFWAYGVFCVMLVLPALRSLQWKRPAMIFVSLVAVFTVQMYFSNTNDLAAYRTLMIDGVLGIAFGCSVWYLSKIRSGDWFGTLRITLVIALTALLKDSGSMLAGGAIVAALLFLLYDAKRSGGGYRHVLLQTLLLAAIPLVPVLIWRSLLADAGIVNHIGMEHTADLGAFIKTYLHALIKTDIVSSPVFAKWGGPELATYATTGVLCAAFAVFGCLLLNGASRKDQIRALGTLAIMNAAYVIGLGALFVRGFGGYLPSYERYIATIAQANMIVILLGFLQLPQEDAERALMRSEWSKLGLAAATVAIVAVFSFSLARIRSEEALDAQGRGEQIAAAIAASGDTDDETKNIYLAFPRGETGILHHQLYYALIGHNIRVINYYDNTTLNRGHDASAEMIDEVRRTFCSTVRETDCDYVYFAADIPLAAEQLPDLFAAGTESGALYSIENSAAETLRLQRIGVN